MKLYRYEVFTWGEWEGIWSSSRFWDMRATLTDEQNDLYYENLSLKLHAPQSEEFKNKVRPKNSKFYFTENGNNKFKQYLQILLDGYSDLNIEYRITELDLNQCNKYECFYQDENQICIEIKED